MQNRDCLIASECAVATEERVMILKWQVNDHTQTGVAQSSWSFYIIDVVVTELLIYEVFR